MKLSSKAEPFLRLAACATLVSSDEDIRGRFESGATVVIPARNIRISGAGFYDGIGTADFKSYGATVNVRIPV